LISRQLSGARLVYVDEVTIPSRTGGVTVRTFDTATREWSIHWVTGEVRLTTPPVVGTFRDGVGIFLGDDERTWEVNGTNELTRVGGRARWGTRRARGSGHCGDGGGKPRFGFGIFGPCGERWRRCRGSAVSSRYAGRSSGG
jgi:hypothetical protein